MKTPYGEIPAENLSNYFEMLINKTFKILPMKESKTDTLKSYIDSFLTELIGNAALLEAMRKEPAFISLLATVSYLANCDYDVSVCKKEVFKCIHLLKDIRERCCGGDDHAQV